MIQALPEDYPVHTDNITMVFEANGKISEFSEELYLNALKVAGEGLFDSLEEFDEYKQTKIDGHNALVIRYSITYYGIEMRFIQCMIELPSGGVSYTFTMVGDYADELERSFESIAVK